MRFGWVFMLAAVASAQVPSIRLHRVASGFENPTDIKFPDDESGRMFVLEQRGRVRVIKNGSLVETPFLDIQPRVGCCGERGLLGIAFPPDFGSKQHFYVNYTDTQGTTVVSRFRVSGNPDVADAASEQVVLTIAQPFSNHNGGNLVFGPDGYLYIGTGDGGSGGDPQGNGQRTDTLLGKMLRIDVESGAPTYTSPGSNPFVGRSGYRPEIWAVGLRNPWRYSFDRETGDLWIADVGQNRAEEVSFQPGSSRGGENYGWNRMEGQQCYPANSNCSRDGLTIPVIEYGRSQGFSITGGYVYRGSRYPTLQGIYLYADFGSGNIWGYSRDRFGGGSQLLLSESRLGVSTFGEDTAGELYVTDHGTGSIYLITAGVPTTQSDAVVNAASFQAGVSPGSLATVFGAGITSFSGTVSADRLPLPTQLAGTSVSLNGTPAPLVAVANVEGREQINFQVPWEVGAASQVTMVIAANGQQSAPVEVPLIAAQPEIFAVTGNLTIWATGLGPVTNQPRTAEASLGSPLSETAATPQVTINGADAPVTFAGLAPNFVGLYQINVDALADASGDVVVSLGGRTSRPFPIR